MIFFRFFETSFNKLHNAEPPVLDYIFHMALKLFEISFFGVKMLRLLGFENPR